MTVTITHTLEKSIDPTELFLVTDTVTASTNIETQVFVFDVDEDEFNHVATAADMQLYPNTKVAAVAASLGYYRLSEVSKGFSSASEANAFGDLLADRLKLLCVDYDVLITDYVGSVTETVSS